MDRDKLLKQHDIWWMFDAIKRSHVVQREFGGTTPYSLMIEIMLEDESESFCYAIAEKALKIAGEKRAENKELAHD